MFINKSILLVGVEICPYNTLSLIIASPSMEKGWDRGFREY